MARAYNQAQKFGVEMAIPDEVISLEGAGNAGNGVLRLNLANNEAARARSIVIATGARYRRLAVEGLDSFEGTSVHYWASPLEAKLCAGEEVTLVGAGNSAGQAAVYLASHVSKVWMLVRGADLAASMSRYLVDRITGLPNSKGFVLTGVESGASRRPLETSRSGVYAIGDVRSGSVKRVASAVGEGAQVVAALHAALASIQGDSTNLKTPLRSNR